jgi:hypothetical protein
VVHLQGGLHGLQSQAGHRSQVRQGTLHQTRVQVLQHQAWVLSVRPGDLVQQGAQHQVQRPVLQQW